MPAALSLGRDARAAGLAQLQRPSGWPVWGCVLGELVLHPTAAGTVGWKAKEELSWTVASLGVIATLTPVFLPVPHFTFMKIKFFMNYLYFSFFSPVSFLLRSVTGREVSFSAGMLPRKLKVPGFLVVSSAHGFLFLLFVLLYFSLAVCAVALTTKCRAHSHRVWKRTLLQKGDSPQDLANPCPTAGRGLGSVLGAGLPYARHPEGFSQHLCASLRVTAV